MLETIKRLVRERDICVLATVSGAMPHCSLMSYVNDADCREIYMVTHRDTTKYNNLEQNPLVSLLIDTREGHTGASRQETLALTVDGLYRPITEEVQRTSVRAMLLERHPHLKVFLDQPDAVLLRIQITSFLLLDGLTDAYYEEL